jgi:flagellar basal body-associated protein FliL
MDKGKVMMTVIIVLLVLLLVAVVGVSIFLVNSINTEQVTTGNGERPTITGDLPPTRDIQLVTLGTNLTLNLATSPNGHRGSARISVEVGLDGRQAEWESTRDQIVRQESMARQVVIGVFQSLTVEELRSPEGKANASEIIMRQLQDLFESHLIVSVVFGEWTLV